MEFTVSLDNFEDIEVQVLDTSITKLLKCFIKHNNSPMSFNDIAKELFELNISTKVYTRSTISPMVSKWNNLIRNLEINVSECLDESCVEKYRYHRICSKSSQIEKTREKVFWITHYNYNDFKISSGSVIKPKRNNKR